MKVYIDQLLKLELGTGIGWKKALINGKGKCVYIQGIL